MEQSTRMPIMELKRSQEQKVAKYFLKMSTLMPFLLTGKRALQRFSQTSATLMIPIVLIKNMSLLFLRKQTSSQQKVPIFKGWNLQTRMDESMVLQKTIETYLPPINAKVTEFMTIKRYMEYLQGLAEDMNMPYVNITLDVGAAMNAYILTWNQPELFSNIIIHLGSFHFLKENFQVSSFIHV